MNDWWTRSVHPGNKPEEHKTPSRPENQISDLAKDVASTVIRKRREYGDTAKKAGEIFRILYPTGIRPHQYDDVLLVVRIVDKLGRIAQRGEDGADKGGESPYQDIAGYGLLGILKDEK